MRRGPGRRAVVRAVAAVLAVSVLAACSVREDDAPRALAPDLIPDDIAAPSSATSLPQDGTEIATIFLVENRTGSAESLVPQAAPIEPGDSDTFHERVIEALVGYKTPEGSGYSNVIPTTTDVLWARMGEAGSGEEDILEINLNQLEVSGPLLKLAFAQMVFTAMNIPGVSGVRFLLNNTPVAVPLDVGESAVGAVVKRTDFANLSASTTAAPTTSGALPESPPAAPAEAPPPPQP